MKAWASAAGWIAVAALLASCDLFESAERRQEIVLHTERGFEATGALEASDGDLVAFGWYGYTSDVSPSLNAHPLLVRIDPSVDTADTIVFRNNGYGYVEAAAESDGEIVALVRHRTGSDSETRALRLYRIARDGVWRELCTFDPDFGAHLIASSREEYRVFLSGNGKLAAIDSTCNMSWSYDGIADAVIELASGDVGIIWGSYNQEIGVARIRSGGESAWRTTVTFPERVIVRDVVAAGDGFAFAAVTSFHVGDTYLARISASGELLWMRRYEGTSYGGYDGQGLARIADAGFVLSTMNETNEERVYRSQILRLSEDGTLRWHVPFGGWDRTAFVSDFVMLRDGRIAAVGFGFPHLGGGLISPRFDLIIEFFEGI